MDTRTDSNATLYLAFELSNSKWKLGFTTGLGQKPREINIPARDLDRLHRAILTAKARFGLPESARMLSCYEAGRDGNWLHRHLVERGVENVVVDPSSISVKRKARQAKTDRLDVRKLLKHLIRAQDDPKEWSLVNVPSVEQEDRRHLHRELEVLKRERTRHTNRIKSLLALHGITMEVKSDFLERLAELRLWDHSALPRQVRSCMEREYERRQLVHRQIVALEAERRQALRESEDPVAQTARRLMELRGIGPCSAWLFSSEMFSWREFRNRRQIGSLAGLTPTPHQSGGPAREQGIDKAGIRWVRPMAIEIAWGWLRYQPYSQLTRWYEERFGAGSRRSRRVGIVALARKLLIALWRFLEHGVVPEGALLKV